MKKALCILLVSILTQFILASQRYHFSNLSVKDGLSQLHVTCIYQDKLGICGSAPATDWTSSTETLSRYSGTMPTTNKVSAVIPSPVSSKTQKATYGLAPKTAWINSIKREKDSKDIICQWGDSVNNKILSLHIDADGVLWVGTLSGLFIYERNQTAWNLFISGNWLTIPSAPSWRRTTTSTLPPAKTGFSYTNRQKKRIVRSYQTNSKTLPVISNYIKDIYIE